jgi:hypothetical protein
MLGKKPSTVLGQKSLATIEDIATYMFDHLGVPDNRTFYEFDEPPSPAWVARDIHLCRPKNCVYQEIEGTRDTRELDLGSVSKVEVRGALRRYSEQALEDARAEDTHVEHMRDADLDAFARHA